MLQNMQLAKTASAAGLLDNFMQGENRTASGLFRLREYVVTPGQEYLISGTCVENNDERTMAQDRSMIAKGKNEPTFMISTRSDVQVHHELQKRALLMVFGGAAATIACAAGLLLRLGPVSGWIGIRDKPWAEYLHTFLGNRKGARKT